ncbi:MAG: epoxyqueuosine reductase QueH [Acidobacteriota bacterium]
MKKLLLHTCCAPCAVYVFEKLKKEYDVTGFFYNPNIHPVKEYEMRVVETEKVSAKLGWKMVLSEYDVKEWFRIIKGLEKEPERGGRCDVCFEMRFEKAFKYGVENDFEIVASTLSISPYKSIAQINEAGLKMSKKYGIEFLPENFKKRDGYKIGKEMSLDLGIIHQDYCGCVYSRRDRNNKLKK